jgi:tetratricopeptide (TPR) repeat protein
MVIESILKAVQIKILNWGPQSLQVADCYWNLALVYEDKGALEEAIHYHKQGIQLQQKFYQEGHLNFLEPYKRLGLACYHLNFPGEALEYLTKALDIYRDYHQPCTFQEGSLLSDIGIILYAKGDFKDAIECQEKALDIFLKTTWETHPMIAVTYNNLSLANLALCNYKKSIEHQKKSLQIRVKNNDSKLQATAFENFGQVFKKLESQKQAMKNFQRSKLMKRHYRFAQSDEENANILIENSEITHTLGRIDYV